MVDGRHDRAGSGCQRSGPGKPAYPGRQRSRDREGTAPPALCHGVRPELRGDSGPALPEESSRRSQGLTSAPSSSTRASTSYPPPPFTASTSQLSDGWRDRTPRAIWWQISGCPRWSPTEPWIRTPGRPTPGSWPAACRARSCFSMTMPATPSGSRTQQGSSGPSRPLRAENRTGSGVHQTRQAPKPSLAVVTTRTRHSVQSDRTRRSLDARHIAGDRV